MKLKFNQGVFLSLLLFAKLLFANSPAFATGADSTSFYSNFQGIKLTDQNGVHFETALLASKISIFNFIYTECVSVCSLQTSNLLKVYQSLRPEVKKDVRLVSVSLDPIKDNPKKLKKFASQLNSDVAGWYFLSANFQDLNRLSNKIALFNEDKVNIVSANLKPPKKSQIKKLDDHATGLWLIDDKGQIIQRYVGNPLDINRLKNEIETLHQM